MTRVLAAARRSASRAAFSACASSIACAFSSARCLVSVARRVRCCSATSRAVASARTCSGTSAVSARIRRVCWSLTALRSVA